MKRIFADLSKIRLNSILYPWLQFAAFTPKDMTMKLLHIDSSILASNSVSRQLTTQIVAKWQASHPGTTVDYLDLAVGKTVIVASTRGGVYSTSEGGRAMEHQESYLQTVFGFLGITDVRFVRAEGVAMGDAARTQALAAAEVEIRAVALPAANDASAVQAA
jgi:FMN-dependent NADH-azoreductase